MDPIIIGRRVDEIRVTGALRLLGRHEVRFDGNEDLLFHKSESLPYRSNGVVFTAWDAKGQVLWPSARTTPLVEVSCWTRTRPRATRP